MVNEKMIRKRMLDLDIKSIQQLSSLANVSKPVIYEYFNGKSPFSNTFSRLCEALETEPYEVLTPKNQKEQS